MRQSKAIDETKGLSENRETIKMSPSTDNNFAGEHHIDDVRSSETMIVDNMQKVLEVLN